MVLPLREKKELLPVRLCRRSGTCGGVRRTSAKRFLYGLGDGDVAGVTLPAGKTPAPESGATEEPDPGEAGTVVFAGEPGEG